MKELGLVYGRFQLLHLKQMEYLLAAKMRCRRLFVGITVPDSSYYKQILVPEGEVDQEEAGKDFQKPERRLGKCENPATYFERYEMIEASLTEFRVDRSEFEIIPFPIDRPELLSDYIPKNITIYMCVCDEDTKAQKEVLEKLGYDIEVLWNRAEDGKGMSGEEIRERIRTGQEWQSLVPKSVFQLVGKYEIEKRLLDHEPEIEKEEVVKADGS